MKVSLKFAAALVLVAVLVVTATAAAAPRPVADPASQGPDGCTAGCKENPVEQANKQLARRWLAAYEQADVPAMQKILADDFVNHTPGLPADKQGFIADAVAFRASFPAGKFTIYEQGLMAQGNAVLLYGHFEGANTGTSFLGFPVTGATASFDFMVKFLIEDGQITDRWATGDDVTGLLAPLGVVTIIWNTPQ